jgi:hypothetical protein
MLAAVIAWLTAASSRCASASFIGFAVSEVAGGLVVDDCGFDSSAQPDVATSTTAITARAIIRALIARHNIRKQPAAEPHFALTL